MVELTNKQRVEIRKFVRKMLKAHTLELCKASIDRIIEEDNDDELLEKSGIFVHVSEKLRHEMSRIKTGEDS